jgi:tape measure domain-containing protein
VADIYTISLEDAVTGNAYRIAKAYVEVSEAAKRMRNAVVVGDQALKQASRDTLELARNELRAAKAAQTAGNAIARLGPKMQAVKPPSLKRPTAEAFHFSYALNAVANAAISAGFALVSKFASGVVDAGKALYETADLASRAHMSFANFFGGQAAGDKVLRESIEIAKRYGFSIDDITQNMNRFGAAGFNAEQSKGLLRFGADMLAAGRSVQDVKGIFLAMTQIQGKGKLQAEELTQQLAERGINAGRVWQILSGKLLHGDETKIKEVMALQKKGLIKSGMALNAIVQAGVEGVHGNKIGKAGEAVADKTIGGLGRRMATLWETSIFDAVDNATPALVRGMQSIFAGLSGSTTTGLQQNLTTVLESVGSFMEKVGPQIPAMVDGFTKAFGQAAGFKADDWTSFASSLPQVARDMGAIAGFFAKIAGIVARFTLGADVNNRSQWAEGWANAGDAARANIREHYAGQNLLAGGGAALRMSDTFMNQDASDMIAADVGKNIADGMAEGMLKNAPTVGRAAESVGDSAIDAAKTTLGVQSPSKVFKGIGGNLAEGLALGMDQNTDLAMHSAAMMANSTIGASAGASGLDSRRTVAAGSAAGAAVASTSSRLSVRVGDVYVGAGGASGGSDAGEAVRSYFETEFVSMLERHLEGVGA